MLGTILDDGYPRTQAKKGALDFRLAGIIIRQSKLSQNFETSKNLVLPMHKRHLQLAFLTSSPSFSAAGFNSLPREFEPHLDWRPGRPMTEIMPKEISDRSRNEVGVSPYAICIQLRSPAGFGVRISTASSFRVELRRKLETALILGILEPCKLMHLVIDFWGNVG